MTIKSVIAAFAAVVVGTVPALATTTYLYDDLGRLWIVTYDNGEQITYSYDAAGNRTQVVTQTGSVLPPTANNDYVNGSVNTATPIYPLTNDVDPNSPPLTLTITAIPAPPGNGTVTKTSTKITYTPATNFVGNDSFTYTITNGTYNSTATVFVSVIGCAQPPNAVNDNINTKHAIAYTFDPRTNDSDPCSYPLTITKVNNPTAVQHGTVSIVNSGTALKYTPTSNYNGSDAFSYTVSDGHGQTATATVNATDQGVDQAPVAVNDNLQIPMKFTKANSCGPTTIAPSGTLSPMANDSDPDGDKITIVSVGDGQVGYTSNNGDGTVTYTYNTAVNSLPQTTDSFTYKITDGYGMYATATVNVTMKGVTPQC